MSPDRDAETHEAYDTAYDLEHGVQLITATTIADRIDDAITQKLRAWREAAGVSDGII